ncbi:MBL fold metallo-hydrolase [Deinococcus sp.]|uniref:MBL fold metallo-hydrolase n=1 Tax=Deinococcus sp. TaxID=47478 RepID=UPI003C7A9E53
MGSHLHGQYLHRVTRFGAFNSYLLVDGQELTAIDTGMKGSETAILTAARATGLPITRLLLTHAHGDHVGSLDALHALLPKAEVLISAREARFLGGERTLDPAEQRPGAALRGGYTTCTTRPTRLLKDGDRVGSLDVIAAPGHTPGHLVFFDRRDGTLIAGDALQTQAGTAVSGDLRPLFPFPALATYHAPTALKSARALLALRPARLAVGHGPVLDQPLKEMQRAVDSADRRLRR